MRPSRASGAVPCCHSRAVLRNPGAMMMTLRMLVLVICLCAVVLVVALTSALAACGGGHVSANGGESCRARDLAPRAVHAGIDKAGIAHAAIALTNTGEFTCRLSGVPTLALVGRNGYTRYTPPQVSSGNSGATLRHGQTASFWL